MKYQTILADPPWEVVRSFGGANWRNGERERPKLDYPTMTVEEIGKLDIPSLATESTALYLWTVQGFIESAFSIIHGWDFKPVCTLVWCKPKGGFVGGAYFSNVEFLIYAKRSQTHINGKINSQWFTAPRGRHSEKPELFQDIIEQVSAPPRIELFARRKRFGWDTWGNEVQSDITL